MSATAWITAIVRSPVRYRMVRPVLARTGTYRRSAETTRHIEHAEARRSVTIAI
jgi:hypothetical protein